VFDFYVCHRFSRIKHSWLCSFFFYISGQFDLIVVPSVMFLLFMSLIITIVELRISGIGGVTFLSLLLRF